MALEQGFSQEQRQVQKLAMTQRMQQSIQVLRYNAEDLQAYLKQQELDNPFISVNLATNYNSSQAGAESKDDWQTYTSVRKQQSLFEYLLDQIHLTMRATPIRKWVIYLLEHLDSNGYLRLDLKTVSEEQGVSEITLLDALTLLQRLDPPGVGARNLQECLLLQIENDAHAPKLAQQVIKNEFEAFADRKWEQIAKKLGVRLAEIQTVFDYVRTLSPAPGAAYDQDQVGYIIPDLVLIETNQQLELKTTKYTQPQLEFKKSYYDRLAKQDDQEVKKYLAQKQKEYEHLYNDLLQRGQTLLRVGQEIVDYQRDFFIKDEHPLKPLLLRDVAHKLQLHESTISRAVNGKYMQTSFGTFELKHFFSQAVNYQTETGEAVSSDDVHKYISELVANEDKRKPLSDQKLSELLKQKELTVSRRTVAKYREQLNIPSSSKRKRFD